MYTFVYFVLIPFVFSVILAFFLLHDGIFSIYTLSIVSLFSFLAILLSSFLQLLIFLLFSQFLKQKNVLSLLFNSFIYSGAIEELIKFLFFYFILVFIASPHFKKLEQNVQSCFEKSRNYLIILAMFFASCFAGFENIAYTVFDINLLHKRIATASLFHIFVAPYYLKAISKTKNINFFFLVIPIFLHGTYNVFIMTDGIFLFFSFMIILFLLIRTYQIASFRLN